MTNSELNGAYYYKLLLGGYENLYANQAYIDSLNVFPIPDGDTGKNMVATLTKSIAEMQTEENISELAKAFSKRCLFSARGNSGVILSQFFNGISKYLQSLGCPATIDVETFVFSLKRGYEQALSSVSRPVEGTILTVLRETVEYLIENLSNAVTFIKLFEMLISKVKQSLNNTPNLLRVLKEAGVVDAGGAGILCFFEGMQAILEGKKQAVKTPGVQTTNINVHIEKFTNENYTMVYGYCTEFMLQLLSGEGREEFNKDEFVEFLHTLGDSVVVVLEDDILKIHVHTFTPEKVLERAHKYGEFLSVKIENMDIQNLAPSISCGEEVKKEHLKNAVVAVSTGEGISKYFLEIGANCIINVEHSKNPSAEEFIQAFKTLDAENIIVLPNDKNIVLVAYQAKKLYKDANVHVIETSSIAEGYSALSMMERSEPDTDRFIRLMERNVKNVTTGKVAIANKSTTINRISVKKNTYVGIVNGEITNCNTDKNQAVISMLENLSNIDEKEIITVFVGCDVTDAEKDELSTMLEEKYPLYDINFIDGYQEVYFYVLSIE